MNTFLRYYGKTVFLHHGDLLVSLWHSITQPKKNSETQKMGSDAEFSAEFESGLRFDLTTLDLSKIP